MAISQSTKLAQLAKSALMLDGMIRTQKAMRGQDVIRVDVPLFLRLLEYSREDAKQDADLHTLAEKLTEFCREGNIARMRNYDNLVGTEEGEQENEEDDKAKQAQMQQMQQMQQQQQMPQMPQMPPQQQ